MIEDALTSYDIRKFYLSILYVIRRIDDVPGIYFLNNHQEHHPMQKHILSTCLAISLIANSSYVFADQTITGGSSSSSTSEMSDGQAAAVVGGLLLLGGILSLHSQSVAKDQAITAETAKVTEEAATIQATKTITLKPGNTYLWSHVDYSPVIEYVESCSPPKQYHNTGNLVNGTVKIGTGSIDPYTESCTRTYDTRQKTVQQYSGNPWNLNEVSYKKWLAAYEASKASAVEMINDFLHVEGNVSSATLACYERCDAGEKNTLALCSGMNSSDKHDCKINARQAYKHCTWSCQ